MSSKDPFTIRIFVPDGDPEGLRIIDRMNWTGLGIVFPREKWPTIRQRPEFNRAGVYILVGYKNENDELPTIYIGEGEATLNRIDSHFQNKDFWDRAIVFTATNNSLNKAHVKWLEAALVNESKIVNRCTLDNGNQPQPLGLSEAEEADTRGFLREILQILPLVGLRAFEKPKTIAAPKTNSPLPVTSLATAGSHLDTVIVPAKLDGFRETFLGENAWHAIRISGGMLPKIKYIAAYITQPTSQITHYAPVASIEVYGEEGKYKLNFSEPAKPIGPIPYADAPSGAMQGARYTSFQKLITANKLTDLF